MAFEGFPVETSEFFQDLAAHNDREWWRANKARYEREVDEPVARLVNDLEQEFGPIRRFRPYRDLRFSPDRRPYQEHTSFAAERAGGVLYAQLGADEVLVAGGRWQPTGAELERFRYLVHDPDTVTDIEEQLAARLRDGLSPDDVAVLKTAPRGFSRDHPKIALLRRTRLSVSAHLDLGEWLKTSEVVDVISRLWRSADRWNQWLQENVPTQITRTDERSRRA